MSAKRIKPDVDQLEIVYDVQWKTPGNDDDKAKIIGIVETPDTNLDWNTFKSYLIQNSGNMRLSTDDIRISYIDSDDDLIPIDSEMEFRECLKFSRIRARRDRKIMMKVSLISNGGAKPKESFRYTEKSVGRSSKPKLFCLKKKDISEKVAAKPSDDADKIPAWFENYMSKFKTDLVREISNMVHPVYTLPEPQPSKPHPIEKRKKKKKMPEEDSSDCTDGIQQLQLEDKMDLLRHMQKISKREKKFEKKLDAKLEKLETKTKKIMEKKSHGLWSDRAVDVRRKARQFLASTGNSLLTPPSEHLMDAVPVDEYNYVPHVLKGEIITQVWKVVNNGRTPWTDETELRFAWGSKLLVPLTTVVKCPLLQPDDTGRVKVKLQAPMFAGTFESYWHFHHQGRRFGHWLGCAVIVDDEKCPDSPEPAASSPGNDTAVDLTMKCSSLNKNNTVEDMLMVNLESNAENLDGMPDLNTWANFTPLTPTAPLADLLNIKDTAELKIDNVSDAVASLTICNNTEKETKKPAVVVERNNAEYVSASDSDNISVISGTVSIDSNDSELIEEFVLIPVPTCFDCEQEITEPTAEIPKTPSGSSDTSTVHTSDNNNNMESLKPFPEMPMFLPVPETAGPSENDLGKSQTVIDDGDENNVYMRDAFGNSVPVAKMLSSGGKGSPKMGFNVNVGVGHSTFGDPNFAHGPNGPRFPFGFNHESGVPPQCHNPGGSCNFRPQHDCPKTAPPNARSGNGDSFCSHSPHHEHAKPCSDTFSNKGHVFECFFKDQLQHHKKAEHFSSHSHSTSHSSSSSSSGRQGASTWSHRHHNIHTEQPRPCSFSHSFETRSNGRSTTNSSRYSSPRTKSKDTSPDAEATQILPGTLLAGAVNVASTAVNTARSVMKMLIPRHDSVITGDTGQRGQITAQMEAHVRTLAEMGFVNRDLNISLLTLYNNDIARVISDLIQ